MCVQRFLFSLRAKSWPQVVRMRNSLLRTLPWQSLGPSVPQRFGVKFVFLNICPNLVIGFHLAQLLLRPCQPRLDGFLVVFLVR